MHPPSVDSLARALRRDPALAQLSHSMLVDVARTAVQTNPTDAAGQAQRLAVAATRSLLRPVINATGVLLHTNLGRAPLPIPGAHATSVRASNLEFDLESGRRGSRRDHAAALAARLCGADAALVVNNCAGALVLVMAAMAEGRGVLVSRGELVEIGGAFRIPDVLRAAGAELIEVGTTNRTRLSDYVHAQRDHSASGSWAEGGAAAAGTSFGSSAGSVFGSGGTGGSAGRAPVALVLKVHQSNFRVVGFTEEVGVAELATLGLPVVADIGSGLLDERLPWLADASGAIPQLDWLRNEPGARQSLSAGADLVLFSGDKLLGGPQAGIIAGNAAMVEACARHPMARALRPGSLVLTTLQDTLLRYARNEARSLPFWDMALRTTESLRERAVAIVAAVGDSRCTAAAMHSVPGGGTLPDRLIESFGVCLDGSLSASLRRFHLPIAARAERGKTWCDLRTVDPHDDSVLIEAITSALQTSSGGAILPGSGEDGDNVAHSAQNADNAPSATDGDLWLGENDHD